MELGIGLTALIFTMTRVGAFGSSTIELQDRILEYDTRKIGISHDVHPVQNYFLFNKYSYDIKEIDLTDIRNIPSKEKTITGYTVQPIKISHYKYSPSGYKEKIN